MCRILFLADINPMGIGFHAVVVFGLGKDYLFKSMLGRCGRVARFNDQQKYTGFQPDPRPADPALSKARDIYAKEGPCPTKPTCAQCSVYSSPMPFPRLVLTKIVRKLPLSFAPGNPMSLRYRCLLFPSLE